MLLALVGDVIDLPNTVDKHYFTYPVKIWLDSLFEVAQKVTKNVSQKSHQIVFFSIEIWTFWYFIFMHFITDIKKIHWSVFLEVHTLCVRADCYVISLAHKSVDFMNALNSITSLLNGVIKWSAHLSAANRRSIFFSNANSYRLIGVITRWDSTPAVITLLWSTAFWLAQTCHTTCTI